MAKKAKEPKKYTPDVLSSYKYRGYRVREVFNHKTRRREFKARFQLNNFEYTPVADSKKALEEIIDDLIYNARRQKENLEVKKIYPTLAEVIEARRSEITKPNQIALFNRVARNFLMLLPDNIRVNELKKAHFQKYIDWRKNQTGKQTGKKINGDTIDKELYAISSMLSDLPFKYPFLDDYKKPEIPKARGKQPRRTRIVKKESELFVLLNALRDENFGRKTSHGIAHRQRLADELEFKVETGLRRKEVTLLLKSQYHKEESALRNVMRWKTGNVTAFFPLSPRACEILNKRLEINPGEYFFSIGGTPTASDYRTLRETCKALDIAYGRYTDGGFIPHDLRHNFATSVIGGTDIETARELLGHSNILQTGIYLHTDEKKLKQAIQKSAGIELKNELVEIYKDIKRGKIKLKNFIKKMQKLTDF